MERPDLEKFTCNSTFYSIALEEYADFKEKQVDSLTAKVEGLTDSLSEAIDLMEDVRTGRYKPDSFTTQPWKQALDGQIKE